MNKHALPRRLGQTLAATFRRATQRPDGQSRRLARWSLLAATIAVPCIAAALDVPNAFNPGDPISASTINENFEALGQALEALQRRTPGVPVLSDPVGEFTLTEQGTSPVPNLQVEVTSDTGLLRVGLTTNNNGDPGVSLIEPPVNGFTYIIFERSADGESWVGLGSQAVQANAAGGTLTVPPGAFHTYDTPGRGTWHYRVSVDNPAAVSMRLRGARLVVQSMAVP